jgi:hypothetical protein
VVFLSNRVLPCRFLFGLCPLAQRAVGFFARFSSSRGVSGLDLGTAAGHGSRHDATPRVSTPLAPECISSSVSIVFSRSTPGGHVTSPRFVGLENFFRHLLPTSRRPSALSLFLSVFVRFSWSTPGGPITSPRFSDLDSSFFPTSQHCLFLSLDSLAVAVECLRRAKRRVAGLRFLGSIDCHRFFVGSFRFCSLLV